MQNERPSEAINERIRNANGGAIPWLPVTDDPLLCQRCADYKHPYDTCERCGGKLCRFERERIMYVKNEELLYVAITGPDLGGARGHLHIPTQRLVLVTDGDMDGAYVVLGETRDSLRDRGINLIAVAP